MIKIEQLLPLLKKGWVAMDEDGTWYWHDDKPHMEDGIWCCYERDWYNLSNVYVFKDIAPVEDWTKSLMKCGEE